MAELVDAIDSKSIDGNIMRVRFSPWAQKFMKYIIKLHARIRMRERLIPWKLVDDAIANPTKVLYDEDSRILFKKLYKKNQTVRLLLVAGEQKGNLLEIITVIDTSKIKKYL